jgi:hypothetical protein
MASTGGARATVNFQRNIRWIGQRASDGGIARVYLDGVFVADVDTYAPFQDEYQAVVFSATNLAPGGHSLTIEVTGMKNPSSSSTQIVVDAFDVY